MNRYAWVIKDFIFTDYELRDCNELDMDCFFGTKKSMFNFMCSHCQLTLKTLKMKRKNISYSWINYYDGGILYIYSAKNKHIPFAHFNFKKIELL